MVKTIKKSLNCHVTVCCNQNFETKIKSKLEELDIWLFFLINELRTVVLG